MGQPAPGWFPDPFDPARLRWWDGRQWTTHLHPVARGWALTPSGSRPPAPGAPYRRTRVATVALVTAGALLVGAAAATAGGLLAFVPSNRGGGSQAAPAVPTASPTPTSTAATPDGRSGLGASASPAIPSARPAPRASAFSTSVPSATSAPPAPLAPLAPPAPLAPSATAPRPTTPPSTAGPASTAGLLPVVSVIDGDTIRVKVHGVTERVRVIGIDTPELHADECYAQQAAHRMQALVESGKVRLTRDPTQANRDHHGRLLRHVALSDGRQVARVLIAGGFGEEFTDGKPYAGQSSYRSAERAARDAGRGVWSSGCTAPARRTASGSCLIKGNVADGDRIYHVPGQRSYEVTRITAGTGERWFCTERQARDAGWRASRG